jgi:lactoylglutathione lyase
VTAGVPTVALRKVDCVMVRVPDLAAAAAFYTRACGLAPLWRDESSVGMGMPDTDAEIVLHTMDLPREWSVYYLVEDVLAAVAAWRQSGRVVREPFEIEIGWCAVLADPFGNAMGILDMSKGPRSPE